MKKIYEKIAKKNGVSVEEVKRDMQSAIDYAYAKENKSEKEKALQDSIAKEGDKPTKEEFICGVVKKVKQNIGILLFLL